MKTSVQRVLTTLTLLWLAALGQNAQAVVPAPDGCYPNFTTAEGCGALNLLTTGAANTALGWRSLFSDSSGNFNTGVGAGALVLNNADFNTAVGAAALLLNSTGTQNTAVGTNALVFNDSGGNNTAIGFGALYFNTEANTNTAIGVNALFNSLGNRNIALGAAAGYSLSTGDDNIYIGSFGGGNTESDTIRIGSPQTRAFISGIYGVTTGNNDAVAVVIDSDGQLGTMSSAARFKKDVKPMDDASEAILSLKPVSFRYKVHKDPKPQFGLIAEDVAKVNPDLVIYDSDGQPYTVRYDAVNAMLLNEFLKEHKAFLEEQKKVQRLEAAFAGVNERLRDQDAKIERISAQIETSRPGPQVVWVP